MKKKTTYKQQGDVLIKPVAQLPEGLTKLDTKVLQESEITGHHHHFTKDADVTVYQRSANPADELTITPNFGKYIVVGPKGADLYHGKGFEERPADTRTGDHNVVQLRQGVYEIDIVREYCYDTNEPVRVVD